MNLTESIQALEAKNITVAINLGTHQHCAIDSNCPLAVELRRLITDAGVTLKELVEGFVEATAPDPANYDLPEISSKVSISIAGKTLEFELDGVVSGAMKTAIDERFRAVDMRLREVRTLGNGLYSTYLGAIAQAKKTKTLPQLKFSRQELMKANCSITCNSDSYIFLFPTEYHPVYLMRRDSPRRNPVRAKLADEDIERLRQEAWIELTVRGNRFINAMLLDRSAKGIVHYHGRRGAACWGHVEIPHKWDGTLKSLVELKTLIISSLATINGRSLLNIHPLGMLDYYAIEGRSMELGREGTVAPQPRDTAGRFAAREEEAPRTGWGTRTRGGDTAQAEPTETRTYEEEMMRRYGRIATEGNMGTICNLCGETLGHHYGRAGEVCPRDRRGDGTVTLTETEEYQRRWGVDTDDEAADLGNTDCRLCGLAYEEHNGYICPDDEEN